MIIFTGFSIIEFIIVLTFLIISFILVVMGFNEENKHERGERTYSFFTFVRHAFTLFSNLAAITFKTGKLLWLKITLKR